MAWGWGLATGGLVAAGAGSPVPRGVVLVGVARGCEFGIAIPTVLMGLVRVQPPALAAAAPASGALSAMVAPLCHQESAF